MLWGFLSCWVTVTCPCSLPRRWPSPAVAAAPELWVPPSPYTDYMPLGLGRNEGEVAFLKATGGRGPHTSEVLSCPLSYSTEPQGEGKMPEHLQSPFSPYSGPALLLSLVLGYRTEVALSWVQMARGKHKPCTPWKAQTGVTEI